MSGANDKQVSGTHYKVDAGKVEHWDMVIQHQLNYFEGQITKYVMRCRKKNGIEDLKKAQHFLEKYIECYEQINPPLRGMGPTLPIGHPPSWDQIDAAIRMPTPPLQTYRATVDSSNPTSNYVNQDRQK